MTLIEFTKSESRKQLIGITCIIMAILLLLMWHIPLNDFYYAISIVVSFLSLLLLYESGYGLISYASLFHILLYVFSCSYFLLWTIKYPMYIHLGYGINYDDWLEVCRFSTTSMVLFSCGMSMSNIMRVPHICSKVFNSTDIVNIGWVFTIGFLPMRFLVDVKEFLAFLQGGYHNALDAVEHGFLETFAEGFYFGLIFLIIGYLNNKKAATIAFVSFLISIAFGCISGRRQEKIAFFVVAFVIFFGMLLLGVSKRKKRIGFILTFSFAFIALALISTFGNLRSVSYDLETFFDSLFNNFSLNMIFDRMREFGYAAYTNYLTVHNIDSMGCGYGANYIYTWVQVIPNFKGIYTNLLPDFTFVSKIPNGAIYGIGGSIFGELYYNFRHFAFAFDILIGFLIGRVSMALDNIIKNKNVSLSSILLLILSPYLILWIRGEFAYIPRPFVWYTIIFIIVYSLCRSIKEK